MYVIPIRVDYLLVSYACRHELHIYNLFWGPGRWLIPYKMLGVNYRVNKVSHVSQHWFGLVDSSHNIFSQKLDVISGYKGFKIHRNSLTEEEFCVLTGRQLPSIMIGIDNWKINNTWLTKIWPDFFHHTKELSIGNIQGFGEFLESITKVHMYNMYMRCRMPNWVGGGQRPHFPYQADRWYVCSHTLSDDRIGLHHPRTLIRAAKRYP